MQEHPTQPLYYEQEVNHDDASLVYIEKIVSTPQ